MRSFVALLLALFAGAGCGSKEDVRPPPDADRDAGAVVGRADAGVPPPAAGPAGFIVVQSGAGGTAGTAVFARAATGVAPCDTAIVGPCKVQSCPRSSGDGGGAPASAGTLTVAGGSEPVVLQPSAELSNQYALAAGNDATFADGATVVVSASGGEVPAFTSPAVKMPEAIVVSGDRPSIDFRRDYPVAWVGGGPDGKVVVDIFTDGGERNGHLSCAFDAAAGRATVPAEALGHLPDCPGDQECAWLVQPESTVHFAAGGFGIDFTVVGDGAAGMYQQQHDPPAGAGLR